MGHSQNGLWNMVFREPQGPVFLCMRSGFLGLGRNGRGQGRRRLPKGERANLHTLEGDTEHKLQKMRRRQGGIDGGGGVGETRNRKPQRRERTHPRTLQKADVSTAAGIWGEWTWPESGRGMSTWRCRSSGTMEKMQFILRRKGGWARL